MKTIKDKLKQGLEKRIYNEDDFIDDVVNFQKEIILNRLRELFNIAIKDEHSQFYISRLQNYQIVRAFCLDCSLLSFAEIEEMEYNVNQEND